MTSPIGPIWTGGFETTVTEGEKGRYTILWLADKHNDDLQNEGKPPVYYWMPNTVRIARYADTGDFKFHLTHFEGVLNPQTSIDAAPGDGTTQISGGVLGVTTTVAPPSDVLQAAENQILDRFKGVDKKYWGWRIPAAPEFRPVPISANITT